MSSKAEPDEVRTLLGARIRRRRDRLGISQEKLAELAEVDRKHMSSIETGKAAPGVLTLARIAGALGTTVGQLMRNVTWVPNEDGPGHLRR